MYQLSNARQLRIDGMNRDGVRQAPRCCARI